MITGGFMKGSKVMRFCPNKQSFCSSVFIAMKHWIFVLSVALIFNNCTSNDDQVSTLAPVPIGPFELELETVGTGFSQPWGIAFPDAETALITEKAGMIVRLDLVSGLREDLFRVPPATNIGQGGLLDIVLHPDFAQNGWVYVTYSRSSGAGSFTTALGRLVYQNGQVSQFEELFVAQANSSSGVHFGSRIAFDLQGYLYFSIGDRGNQNQAQNLNNHIGCVLRLNADGSVPPDNPFVNTPNALPEIFSYGHRNPQGMARHPVTGLIWSHEHGPQGGDEINILEPGANYGWPLVSFGRNYNGTPVSGDTALPGLTQPIHYWTPSIAPCGMAFINSNRYPGMENRLFIGSLVLQHLNETQFSGAAFVKETRHFQQGGRIREVRQAPDGWLYITNESTGTISRVITVSLD
jgi:glucose/arabinose dehydrogenase